MIVSYAGSNCQVKIELNKSNDTLAGNWIRFTIRCFIRKQLDGECPFVVATSHDHDLLQCLDVVLGAMAFRLNDKHKVKPLDAHRRGKRTIAKEKLYKHILTRIREIYTNFNIGESTDTQGDYANRWRHPYRHWKHIPRNHERDFSKTKP